MSIIACVSCDWTGHHYEITALEAEHVRALEPGQPTPYGVCPQCRAVLPFGKTPEIDGIQKTGWNWRDGRAERPNLTQYQRDCLLLIASHLIPDHPGFRASEEIAVALRSTIGSSIRIPDRSPPFNELTMAPYLQSWVYPLIVGALYGEVYPGHRRYMANDAEHVRNAMKAATQEQKS
jgi:hypothetical protein